MVRTDNMSALYNLEKEGGTHSPPLCYIAWDILTLCLSNQIYLQIRHLTGEVNVVTGKLSCAHKAILTEWTLSVPSDSSRVGRAETRSVCDLPEPQASSGCQSLSGSQSSSPGCVESQLEYSPVGVCFPSNAYFAQGAPEDECFYLSDDPDRASLAGSVLVSRSPLPVSEKAAKHIAVPQRSSTRFVYEGKWAEFCAWCERRKEDPVQASVPLVADFLTDLFERNPPLAVSTIRGYRSAISATVPHGPSLTNSLELGALIRSFAIDHPVTHVFYPRLSLRVVLNFLMKPPFEPIAKCSLENLTLKTVFLVALASGRRRSELCALSFDPECFRFSPNLAQVQLLTEPDFLAKTQKQSKMPAKIVIKSLFQFVGHDLPDYTLFEEIMQAADWSGQSTFTNFYSRAMVAHVEGLYDLGPIVAAQMVVVCPAPPD